MAAPADEIKRAGLFPPAELLAAHARESDLGPDATLAEVVTAFVEGARLDDSCYFLCGHRQVREAFSALSEDLKLPLEEAATFCAAPCHLSDPFALHMLRE